MGMIYVAVNGDSVGSKIGEAILSDDHQALSGLSRKFKDAHGAIEKWAQRKGGEVVASAGDESIFSLPEEMVGELESIKNQYAQASGATLTIGIGATISQASKALIYGKLNDKNQIVEYEPQMDDYISGSQDEEGEQDEEQEEGVDNGEEQFGDEDEAGETGEEFGENEEQEDEEEEGGIPSPDDINDVASSQTRQQEGLGEEEFEDEDEQPAHEQDMSVGEDIVHDSEENEDDEQDDDIIEADEEPEVFGGNTEPMDEDLDEDMIEDAENQTEDEFAPEMEGEDQEGMEEGFEDGSEEDDSEMSDDDIQELSPEDIAGQEDGSEMEGEEGFEDESEGMEGQEEGSDADEFLNEMMHSNMDGQEQDPETAELKQKIFTALQSIKGNREMLDQMKVQNPELYQGIMANIQSMIEMGKKLGMSSQPDEEQGMEGQDPSMMEQPEMEEDPSAMGDELEQAPVKKPQGSFQA